MCILLMCIGHGHGVYMFGSGCVCVGAWRHLWGAMAVSSGCCSVAERGARCVQLTNLLETIITDARGGMHVSQRLAAAVHQAQQALRRNQEM